MVTKKEINLDMDGTFVHLYGVDKWLDKLVNEDISPYRDAKPLVNLSSLARLLNKRQKDGYKINIISWTSKTGTPEYNNAVATEKMRWLAKRMPSVKFDKINIVDYGTPKYTLGNNILFDDEEKNRAEWVAHGGIAYSEKELIETLKKLA